MSRKSRYLRIALSALFVAVFVISGYNLWVTQANYSAEAAVHKRMLEFRPDGANGASGSGTAAAPADTAEKPRPQAVGVSPPEEGVYNGGIAELRRMNGDAAGWICIDGTAIDYPFVRGADNDYYLRRDIYGNQAYAGTIFMDYRNQKDFSDYNTILYGHQMKNGSMFHGLTKFNDRDFFDSHSTGTIYLENQNIGLEIFAFLILGPMDLINFEGDDKTGPPIEDYTDFIHARARFWRDAGISDGDRLVTLSTCSYEFDNARAVLVAKIAESDR